jgi:hypothetical protein
MKTLSAIIALASGAALHVAPAAQAQEFELVPFGADPDSKTAIQVRAQIDVLYTPAGSSEPILVQRAFETSAAAYNLSSEYVFEVINSAALAGVDQALAGGAQTGRISVVAVCYTYETVDGRPSALAPMGVYMNTTDLNVLPDGKAALHTRYRIVPPSGR